MAAIIRTKNILGGKPRIEGTRISVDTIGDFISSGHGVREIREAYPHLNKDEINAALMYIEDNAKNERVKLDSKNS